MRPDIKPGARFADYELPDHLGRTYRLSELQNGDPMCRDRRPVCKKSLARLLSNMMSLKIGILGVLLLAVLPLSAQAATIDAKGYVNSQDIDKAADRSNAITITEPSVTGSWKVKNNGSRPITFTKASLEYAGLLPDREFEFSETISPGGENNGSGSITLPDFVLSLKGLYNVKVQAFDQAGEPVIARTFWVRLGSGSPLTGLVGGTGAILTALSLAAGMGGAFAKSGGLGLRVLSGGLMFLGAPLLILSIGLVSPLQTAPFVAAWAAGVGGVTVLNGTAFRLLSPTNKG